MNLPASTEALLILLLKMGVIYLSLRMLGRGIWLRALIWWPSTLMHELSHFILGFILRADPVDISLWPSRVQGTNQVTLGHVKFRRLSWWKALPVALAPLLLLPLGWYLITLALREPDNAWSQMMYVYAALQCFAGCWPSAQDWALARPGIWMGLGVALAGAAAYAAMLPSN